MLLTFFSSLSFTFKSCFDERVCVGSEGLGEMFLPYQGFSVYVVRSVLFSWYLGAMSYLGRPSHSVLEICESIVSSSSSMVLFMSIKSVLPLRRSSSRIGQME